MPSRHSDGYQRAYHQARQRAIARLIKENPERWGQLLAEERAKAAQAV
jgi:hypothetical protein